MLGFELRLSIEYVKIDLYLNVIKKSYGMLTMMSDACLMKSFRLFIDSAKTFVSAVFMFPEGYLIDGLCKGRYTSRGYRIKLLNLLFLDLSLFYLFGELLISF